MTAFNLGADVVGIGRPIMYANVLHGEGGVYSILNKFKFEIRQAQTLAGQNSVHATSPDCHPFESQT